MNHGYSHHLYTPVMRNPCLFHQNTIRPTPTYYPAQRPSSSVLNAYPPTPALYTRQSSYIGQSPMAYLPHSYSNYPNFQRSPVPPSIPFSSYSMPAFSYAPTSSSKGLTIILIATLVLVALDLVIVRPQKSRATVQSSDTEFHP
ncbi:hypothetical protein [Desulfosporosinus nitroreducens]|uniref:Transmembrane protein n=1 Tax=Desulfosporosinus nitroreducens TaxID=2018668 RepID=A0ABT8QNT3_9FIRM|nr:hypothetical protein [Desulfosporosinus nitroreducens]MCO1599985.1 hypothetical protein [Desulfosporosinus nitroreducens]MDO0822971.1 hypothetical protein [Desulfosporosinus nitroreducens]